MLILRSKVLISDKTSTVKGLCIKILRNKSFAGLGDCFLLSVRSRNAKRASFLKVRLQRKFAVGSIHRALLLRSKKNFLRFPGLFIKFYENACVLVIKELCLFLIEFMDLFWKILYEMTLYRLCKSWYFLILMIKNKIDLYFTYKNVFRFLIFQQWSLFINSYQLPFLKNLFIFFKVYNLTDLDEVRSFIMRIYLDFFLDRRP